MYSALDIADAFVSIFAYDDDGITQLKVQKLLYYAQGCSFQRFGRPLFKEKIEAWKNGPAVNCVYAKYANYNKSPITSFQSPSLDMETERLVLDVAREYGKYTTSELVGRTHAPGTPWSMIYKEGSCHKVIPNELIAEYFNNSEPTIPVFNIEEAIADIPVVDLR